MHSETIMNILITGANGFLGRNLKQCIEKDTKHNFLTPSSDELNLLSSVSTEFYFATHKIDKIIHLAAICGGIGKNKKAPADLTHLNNKMTVNIFDVIRRFHIESFIGMGTVCSYPKFCQVPFKEDDIWSAKSEETNRGYGESKKMLITEFQTHKEQYGLKGVILISTNMYGFHDHFWHLENNHVVPALISKMVHARNNNLPTVYCWGDGSATRDLIFASSVCESIIKVLENEIDYYEPINIGTGEDISIKDLAFLIAKLTGFKGNIEFTNEVSNGQPKRLLDVSRAKEVLGFTSNIKLEDGLKQTIEWYLSQPKIIKHGDI